MPAVLFQCTKGSLMILYRPVGLEELRLVYESGMRAFPPRLPEQPIFYPVLNFEYADQIARTWNTQEGSRAGYVTRFEVDDGFAGRFEVHQVGSREHLELWVPAEVLPELNRHISAPIQIVAAHFGHGFRGIIPEQFGLRGKDATAQFITLAVTLDFAPMDVHCEIAANHVAVFLHYPFWSQHDFSSHGGSVAARDRVLTAIRNAWPATYPKLGISKLPDSASL